MSSRYLRKSAGKAARMKWRLFMRLQQNAAANMLRNDGNAVSSAIWGNRWQGGDSTFLYQ